MGQFVWIPKFLSTLSLRRATSLLSINSMTLTHFYPRSPCGERRYLINTYHRIFGISIHALLAESDARCRYWALSNAISIHALLAESDGGFGVGNWPRAIFLSTLSLRRATRFSVFDFLDLSFLSTLSLRRATVDTVIFAGPMLFLSTLSLRRATAKVHKTVGHFCAYETNFMEIASSC